MFSWATSRLESLAQTVAPPPDTPSTKFVYCCQRSDEAGALEALQQLPDPVHVIVGPANKGQVPLHYACLFSLPQLMQHLLQQLPHPTAWTTLVDSEGNTPLHCACRSNQQQHCLDMVKFLLQTTHPDTSCVCTKNQHGQTPYDVATLNGVRQYLLPIQLQAETQFALDNGGVGLPPGIDLGGMKISNPHLPPPPMGMTMPPTNNGGGGGMMGSPQKYVAQQFGAPPQQQSFPPAPMLAGGGAVPNNSNNNGTLISPPSQQQQYPPNASMFATPSPQYHPQPETASSMVNPVDMPTSNTPSNTPVPARLPAAPTSTGSSNGGYALRGQSSAAIYKSKYTADGFHSSSSDKNLQEKYGHVQTNYSGVPPPPSSGNSAGIAVHSAPNSAGGGGVVANPFAGGRTAVGAGNRGGGASRYVAYDPVRGARPVPQYGGGNNTMMMPGSSNGPTVYAQPAQSYQQPNVAAFAPQQPAGPYLASHSAPSTMNVFAPPPIMSSLASPSPSVNVGRTPTNTPMTPTPNFQMNLSTTNSGGACDLAANTFASPAANHAQSPAAANTFANPYGAGDSAAPSAASTFASPNNAAVFSPATAAADTTFTSSLSTTVGASSPPYTATAATNAATMFGSSSSSTSPSKRPVDAMPRIVTNDSTDSAGSASALFANPPGGSSSTTTTNTTGTVTEVRDNLPPAPVATPPMNAAPLLGGAPTTNLSGNTEQNPVPLSSQKGDSKQGAAVEEENDMQEVPLTPGDGTRKFTSNTDNNNVRAEAAVPGLLAAIGMPPPPFSRK